MNELKLYKSPLKIFRLSFYISFFWIPIFWKTVIQNDGSFLSWSLLFLFSIPYVVNTIRFANNRAALVLDNHGITGTLLRDSKIYWKHIEDAYQVKVKEYKTLVLVTQPDFRVKNEWKQQNEIDSHLNIDISELNIDPEKLVSIVKKFIDRKIKQ